MPASANLILEGQCARVRGKKKSPAGAGPKVSAIEALGLGVVALIMVTARLRYAMQRLGAVRHRVLG